jgi:hypothetical protein
MNVLAWHFVNDTLRDGRLVPAVGEKLVFKDKPILCRQGLHASIDPFDALQFAPGPVLCRVKCGGTILTASDKIVCTERTILASMDFTTVLRYFARMQALSVIHLWDAPDVCLDYLMTGDESIRAAARAAARDAARDAAGAGDAAWAAARAAARDAAWAAARDAAWAAAGKEFTNLVNECFEGVA